MLAVLCMLAAIVVAVGSTTAVRAAEPAYVTGVIDGHPDHGGDRVYVNGWIPLTDITIEVWDGPAKGTLVDSGTTTTNNIGDSVEVYFTDLKPGQYIVVTGGGLTKELELVTLTGTIDVFTDIVSGTAPPAAGVTVDAVETCRQAIADSTGAWSVDFSVAGSGACSDIGDFVLGSHATISQEGLDPDGDRTTIDAVVHDFTDDDGTTFEMDITWLYQEGITKGCNPPTNTEYCPNANVTRGQMAAFLVRALGYTDSGAGDLFTDDDGTIFEDNIDKLATAGVTKGCNPPTNDNFCPNDNVTRGQMAAFLRRALG